MPIRLTDKSNTVYEGILHSRTLAFDYKVTNRSNLRIATTINQDCRLSTDICGDRTCPQVKCNMAADELNQAGSNEHTPRGCKWFSSPEEYKLRKQ